MVRNVYCDKSGLKKGTWTPEEDRKLMDYVTRYGCWNWRQLPRFAGLARCGKSCRLRWMNYLRPNVKRGNFTAQEEETIIKLHAKMGNRWSAIAAELPGRTDNEIKNYWHTKLKKGIEQHSATCEKTEEVYKSKDDSPVESRQEISDSVSVIDSKKSQDSPSTSQPSVSEFSCISTETMAASDQHLVLEHEDFISWDTYIEPVIADIWTEPHTGEFSFVPIEMFTPLGIEPEFTYSAELWGENNCYDDQYTSLF